VDEQWSKGRTVTRLATAGLAAVLLVLTEFALWAAFSTNRAAGQADRLSRLSDAYQQARFAVAAEESLERKYRLEGSGTYRGAHGLPFGRYRDRLLASVRFGATPRSA
jgi:hypothetical protein